MQALKFAVQSFTSQAVLCNMRAAAAAQTLIFQRAHENSAFLLKVGKLLSVLCFKMNLEPVLFRACLSVHWFGSSVDAGSRMVSISVLGLLWSINDT